MLFPSNGTYAVRCPPVSITSASMPRAPIPWSAVAKPRREAYPTRTRSFGACSAACVAAFAAWMISWLRSLPNSVSPTPGSRQLCASTKIASRAPTSRASWTAAWPVALSMSSVGFGANEATISTSSPKACARALARAYVTRQARPTFGPKAAALIIFFSSRRRHTRFDCDWSSDVCSSDLLADESTVAVGFEAGEPADAPRPEATDPERVEDVLAEALGVVDVHAGIRGVPRVLGARPCERDGHPARLARARLPRVGLVGLADLEHADVGLLAPHVDRDGGEHALERMDPEERRVLAQRST